MFKSAIIAVIIFTWLFSGTWLCLAAGGVKWATPLFGGCLALSFYIATFIACGISSLNARLEKVGEQT